jgi:hypothetical protein
MKIDEPYYSAERLLRSGLLAQFLCALITLSHVLKLGGKKISKTEFVA